MDHKPVVTRYAPSPTGFQHIGGIRTALFAYLWAKKNNGTFILRIEDTDKSREVAGAIEHTIDAMTWLGMTYDIGPDKPSQTFGSCLQSDRLDIYKQYAQKLIDQGLAYPDPYTDADMAAFREQAEAENRPFLYRHHRPENPGKWDGTRPLRLKTPEIKRYTWHDAVRGELTAGEDALDDFILIKADGYPTYNFAHIVDDQEMGVTHVMRGQEFISSTPKYLSLYDALGIPYPVFVTLPPIMAADGKKKLGKRDGAKDVLEYRADGYLPVAMRNFLALIGWNPGGDRELFNESELISAFSLDKIQKSGGAFNEEKLQWMNKEYLAKLSESEQITYVQTALPDYDQDTVAKLAQVMLERLHNQTEIRSTVASGEYDWAFSDISYNTELLKWKNDASTTDVVPRLKQAQQLLTTADFTSADTIKSALWDYASEIGRGEVLWPLRVALSGRERSPDPFTCAYVLGQVETLKRIESACDKIAA
jgi:glutamyl-tRNA synthetase